MKVEITCPDEPLIEKHCRDTFEEKFNQVLSWQRKGLPEEDLQMFQESLRKEAKRQQWYQFEEWGDGLFVPYQRQVLRNEDHTPKLLVPQVRIIG